MTDLSEVTLADITDGWVLNTNELYLEALCPDGVYRFFTIPRVSNLQGGHND